MGKGVVVKKDFIYLVYYISVLFFYMVKNLSDSFLDFFRFFTNASAEFDCFIWFSETFVIDFTENKIDDLLSKYFIPCNANGISRKIIADSTKHTFKVVCRFQVFSFIKSYVFNSFPMFTSPDMRGISGRKVLW